MYTVPSTFQVFSFHSVQYVDVFLLEVAFQEILSFAVVFALVTD